MTWAAIELLRWETLYYPAYSSDLAFTDYQLFWFMDHFFREKNISDIGSIKKEAGQLFDHKLASLYEKGVKSLLEI